MATEMPNIEAVMSRIRKLQAKAESATTLGNAEEADAFASKVQELLAKHKLDMSSISVEVQDVQNPLSKEWIHWDADMYKRKRINWMEQLAETVAGAHFCRTLISSHSNSIMVVGRKQDREIAQYVITTLARFALEESTREFWRERARRQRQTGSWAMGSYRQSWLMGFVRRIGSRYFELMKAQRSQTGMALVVSRSTAEVSKFIDEEIKPVVAKGSAYREAGDAEGLAHGARAADRADISGRGIKDGPKRDQVGKARPTLGSGE